MTTLAGTPYFISPEVLKGVYGKECDMWSLGVLLYILLSGEFPFNGESRAEVFGKIQSGQVAFKKSVWKQVSKEGQNLISKLLLADVKKRLTARAAIKHPWFEKYLDPAQLQSEQVGMSAEVIQNLREFKGQSQLKKASLNILVKMMRPSDLTSLKDEFQKIDTDHSGFIEFKELERALKSSNVKLDIAEID
jgi:calcium-dependent protein kinase